MGKKRKVVYPMEVIRINDSKLKVMLTEADMASYAITATELDEDSERSRHVFFRILERAQQEEEFDTEQHRLFVQIYPSREGGCELYIVKLPPFDLGQEGRVHLKQGLKTGYNVYVLPDMQALLQLCALLRAVGYREESSAYAEAESTQCYLLLRDALLGEDSSKSAYPFVGEYATRQNGSTAFLYLKEHCACLCAQNAVQRLGALFVAHREAVT